ncbi:MAG: sigma-54 dependent transcriptional regulator [Proteobacteria bacterium]|nr:sigma-54 dependent transcriptional regulator [Pseudomonadota bacterium]
MPRETILVLDDEPHSLDAIRRTLDDDFEVRTATDLPTARAHLQAADVSVILCDQRMPGTSGIVFLKEVRERWPDCVRIIVSGYTDSEDIIAGINEAGLYQYLLKPWMPDHLLSVVREAVQARALQHGISRLELDLRAAPAVLHQRHAGAVAQASAAYAFEQIRRAPGSPLDALCEVAARVAVHNVSVLLLGASGTGKELLARAMHYASPRISGPFVVENCAALADTLLESELFGHRRGAFTGAVDDHVGLFQRAHGGTVFLDEIGETSPHFQVKLLRVLQEREVRPVGATRAVPVDVRVLCATHRDLAAEVQAGRFREDLYYRLAEFTLTLPPLRERLGDLTPIAEHLLAALANEHGRPAPRFTPAALAALHAYGWPGNVRELRNELRRAVVLADGLTIGPELFSATVTRGQTGAALQASALERTLPARGTLQERLDAVEAMILKEALLRHRWNKTQAAQELGLSRVGLRAKLQRLEVAP